MPIIFKIFVLFFLQQGSCFLRDSTSTLSIPVNKNVPACTRLLIEGDVSSVTMLIVVCVAQHVDCVIKRANNENDREFVEITFKSLSGLEKIKLMNRIQPWADHARVQYIAIDEIELSDK